jgi:hypothetical protein
MSRSYRVDTGKKAGARVVRIWRAPDEAQEGQNRGRIQRALKEKNILLRQNEMPDQPDGSVVILHPACLDVSPDALSDRRAEVEPGVGRLRKGLAFPPPHIGNLIIAEIVRDGLQQQVAPPVAVQIVEREGERIVATVVEGDLLDRAERPPLVGRDVLSPTRSN